MDKISKVLGKLTKKERENIKLILVNLLSGKTKVFDIKKLKGREDIFRIRKNKIRIIYRRDEKGKIFIIKIDRRSEDTYRF